MLKIHRDRKLLISGVHMKNIRVLGIKYLWDSGRFIISRKTVVLQRDYK